MVAGIVGMKKFAYDIWGDTVNTASRLESSGVQEKLILVVRHMNLLKTNIIVPIEVKYRLKVKVK